MAGVPVVFRDTRERVLANYDWTNIIQGQGIVTYYLFQGETDSGVFQGASSDSAKRSNRIELTHTTGSGSSTKNSNFDIGEFNQAMTLEGTAYISGSFFVLKTSGSGSSGDVSIILTLVKVSTGTTDIVAVESQSISTSSSLVAEDMLMNLQIPKTTFKAGDVLRLEMTIKKDGGSGGVWRMGFGTDPLNRDGTDLKPDSTDRTTTTKVNIPFKVDI